MRTLDGKPIATLVIPTLNRYPLLASRLPMLAEAGFDEVIVVDSTTSKADIQALGNLCDKLGAKYVNIRVGRSKARNVGASLASGVWLFFCDDDGYVITRVNKESLAVDAADLDALRLPGHLAWIFRREFFQRIGGYDESLVAGEDDEITRRAFEEGRVGSAEGFVDGAVIPLTHEEQKSDQWRRLRNHLEYGTTMLVFASRHPHPASVVRATLRRGIALAKGSTSRRTGFQLSCLFFLTLGFVLSPFYSLTHSRGCGN